MHPPLQVSLSVWHNGIGHGLDHAAIGANILCSRVIAVDITFSYSGDGAKLHGDCHADILGDGKEAGSVPHTAAHIAARRHNRIPAALGSGIACLGIGGDSNRNADRGGLVAYSRTGLHFIGCAFI